MNAIKHVDSNTGNGPGLSGALLSGFPVIEASLGIDRGTYVFEDFDRFSVIDAEVADGSDGAINGFYIRQDSAAVTRLNEVGGVIRFETDGSANDEVQITTGDLTASTGCGFCRFPTAVASRKKFFFEARVRLGDVSDMSMFVGLKATGVGSSATARVLDDGASTVTAGQSLIGFWLNTTGDLKTLVANAYNSSSAGTFDLSAALTALSDATWVKFSILYEPGPADSGSLKLFVDNAVVTSYADVDVSLPTQIDEDQNYAGVIYGIEETGAANTLDIDHIAYGTTDYNA